MDYRSALDYVLSFSDYERWPGAGYAERWDLRRMEEFLSRLDNPHLGRRTIHIAGTKGKGSTAAMIASAVSAAGFCTGFYTSPHLHTIRERIQVGGEMISEDEFADLTERVKPAIEDQNRGGYGELSTFEVLTALAFCHFRQTSADFQVLETGLGGRLDATNVTRPEVAVITSISLDHMAVLGDTIAKIAAEKAGIIKPGITVVSSPQTPEATEVIRSVCREKQARLITVGQEVTWRGQGSSLRGQSLIVRGVKQTYEATIPLLGEHQLENAATAIAALETIGLERTSILSGLAKVRWPGRMQVLKQEPLLVADGAHNGDSARKLRESMRKYFQFDRAILILGTSADKNSEAMIAELSPAFSAVITTRSDHPRASDADKLAAEFARRGVTALATENVDQALAEAGKLAGSGDLICATGSLFLVAEVIEKSKGITGERYPKTGPGATGK